MLPAWVEEKIETLEKLFPDQTGRIAFEKWDGNITRLDFQISFQAPKGLK